MNKIKSNRLQIYETESINQNPAVQRSLTKNVLKNIVRQEFGKINYFLI